MSYTTTMNWLRDFMRFVAVAGLLWLSSEAMALRDAVKTQTQLNMNMLKSIERIEKDIEDLQETDRRHDEIYLDLEAQMRNHYGRR